MRNAIGSGGGAARPTLVWPGWALRSESPQFAARAAWGRWLPGPACAVFLAAILAIWIPAAGCFSAPEAPPTEKTCQSNCERQARLGCSATDADFEATCKDACLAYRASYAACVQAMNSMSGCVDHKVTFSCDATGRIAHDPVAICMEEEYACYACTGDFEPCRN